MLSLKNLLLKNLVPAIKRFIPEHPQTENRRFLLISTTALGDTLWATPAIESLRNSFPKAYIAILTSPIGHQVLKHNPHLSKVYTLDRFSFSLWKKLYQDQFDTILLFHASQRLILPLLSLLGAQNIIGTSGINKGLDRLLTDPMPPIYEHEISRRLRIVEKAGGKTATERLSFFLQPQEKLKKQKGRWIAIHPGSKDPFKRWPTQNFIQLGKDLKKHLNCEILITGTAEEELLMKSIANQIPGAHVANPHLSLRSFAALLETMDLLICNDTGPFHLACALNKPVIGIYSSTDPNLCGGHHCPSAITIGKRATCDPCLKRKCRLPFCLLQIGPCEVLNAALKVLS